VYLDDKQELSNNQNLIFMDILNKITSMHDGNPQTLGVESLSIRISKAWQMAHYQQMTIYPMWVLVD